MFQQLGIIEGSLLAVAGGALRLFGARTRKHLADLAGHRGSGLGMAFSPDSRVPIGIQATAVAFGAGNQPVATGFGSAVFLKSGIPLRQMSATVRERLCRNAQRSLTPGELIQYLLAEPYHATCPPRTTA